MLFIASLFAAIIPMFTYLLIIWRTDRYDREPFSLIIINYIYGAVGAILLAVIGSELIAAMISYILQNEEMMLRIQTIFVAPVVEETTKGFFLFLMVANKKFDNITDGIVYGGAIGLGFGMTENFFYFVFEIKPYFINRNIIFWFKMFCFFIIDIFRINQLHSKHFFSHSR